MKRLFLIGVSLLLAVGAAVAAQMIGVGTLMSSQSSAGTPGSGFAILTEAGVPLTTESNSQLVTEDAP